MSYNFNKEELKKCVVTDLRKILRELGGTPGNISKEELIETIIGIQQNEIVPNRNTRGRKASSSFSILSKMEEVPENAQNQLVQQQAPQPTAAQPRACTQPAASKAPADKEAQEERKQSDLKELSEIKLCDNDEDEAVRESGDVSGVLEIQIDGYGFLRAKNYEATNFIDTFVSRPIIKSFGLRRGDFVTGRAERTREAGAMSLTEIYTVNDHPPKMQRRNFDDLVPCYPDERITLENSILKESYTLRMTDLLFPVGKGQRGLIVAPPKTGKTTFLKKIAQSIEHNHPDIHLIVLLIDERPEEVTDLRRSVKGEVVYSTFDEPAEHHARAADLVMWRAKRLVELGKDVVVLLDSITRLARAHNQLVPSSGKVLSGGLDPAALQQPKKFFGSARNIEGAGSLTILATALIDTGSKMDEVVYEEFKGTGNMEIHLTRELAEKRIFPAIDMFRSGTRKDELLLTEKELDCAVAVRRFLGRDDGVETLIDMIKRTQNNEEFMAKFAVWARLLDK